MTRIFTCPKGLTLANDNDDVRSLCVAAGRIQYECDLPDEHIQDVTPLALAQSGEFAPTLQALMDANRRGCVYPDPKGWTVIPLSSQCPGLHDKATAFGPCPRCFAKKGNPCVPSDKFPIMEGTAHRARVRVYVLQHPEALTATPIADTTGKPWLDGNATELMDCPTCNAPAGFPCACVDGHQVETGKAQPRPHRRLGCRTPRSTQALPAQVRVRHRGARAILTFAPRPLSPRPQGLDPARSSPSA